MSPKNSVGVVQRGLWPIEHEHHGGARKFEYRVWSNLKHRSNQMCPRWDRFGAFLEDVGPRPSPKHKLITIDKSKPAGPGNCRWSLLKPPELRVMAEDLTGRRSGRLTAVRLVQYGARSRWLCRCDCGGTCELVPYYLKTQHIKSCGCIHERHGMIRTPEYACWSGLRQRCENPKSLSYHNYGGRGIKVCPQWKKFGQFLADMGRRPSPLHSLDRKDVNGDYEPRNCRWATQREQSSNRRNLTLVTFNARTQCLQHWADELGICTATLIYRLRRWPLERALTEPCNQPSRSILTRASRRMRQSSAN
jgi:hypothetical protein